MSTTDKRNSLRDQQADLTRDLIVRAFQELLRNDHPDAITYPQVAEAAGVSLRTVYRYFPTRADLLRIAAAWFGSSRAMCRGTTRARCATWRARCRTWGACSTSTRTSSVPCRTSSCEAPRRAAVAAAIAEVAGELPPEELRGAEAMLVYIRSGRAWLVLHERHGLAGDEVVATLDWAASALLDDLRRRAEQA